MRAPETPVVVDLGAELASSDEIKWLASQVLEAHRQTNRVIVDSMFGSTVADKTLAFRVDDTKVTCGVPGLMVRYPNISIETQEKFAIAPGGAPIDVRIRDKLKNASSMRNRPAYYCMAGSPEYIVGGRRLRPLRRSRIDPLEVIPPHQWQRKQASWPQFEEALGPRSGPNLSKERATQLLYLVETILSGRATPLNRNVLE